MAVAPVKSTSAALRLLLLKSDDPNTPEQRCLRVLVLAAKTITITKNPDISSRTPRAPSSGVSEVLHGRRRMAVNSAFVLPSYLTCSLICIVLTLFAFPDTMSSDSIPYKKVWTTLITNTAYLPGLLALEYSLRLAGSKYPLVALYTSTFPPEGHEALDRRGILKMEIKYLLPVSSKDYSNDPRFYDCWSKLQPFGLTQFERVVQLDSDMVVIKNMDELFDLELGDNAFAAGWACVCNPMGFEHYPKDWIEDNCAFTGWYDKMGGKQGDVIGPDVKDDHGLMICNGGLQLVAPSKDKYDKILSKMDDDLDYDFADQSLLSDVFKDQWIGLSFGYNYLKTMKLIHKDLDFQKVKNIHYILTPKPWNVDRSFKDDTDTFHFWWDINEKRLAEEKSKGHLDGF